MSQVNRRMRSLDNLETDETILESIKAKRKLNDGREDMREQAKIAKLREEIANSIYLPHIK